MARGKEKPVLAPVIERTCANCKHRYQGQCLAKHWDVGLVGRERRRIIIDPAAKELYPLQHIYRFWCKGDDFEAGDASIDEYLAIAAKGLRI